MPLKVKTKGKRAGSPKFSSMNKDKFYPSRELVLLFFFIHPSKVQLTITFHNHLLASKGTYTLTQVRVHVCTCTYTHRETDGITTYSHPHSGLINRNPGTLYMRKHKTTYKWKAGNKKRSRHLFPGCLFQRISSLSHNVYLNCPSLSLWLSKRWQSFSCQRLRGSLVFTLVSPPSYVAFSISWSPGAKVTRYLLSGITDILTFSKMSLLLQCEKSSSAFQLFQKALKFYKPAMLHNFIIYAVNKWQPSYQKKRLPWNGPGPLTTDYTFNGKLYSVLKMSSWNVIIVNWSLSIPEYSNQEHLINGRD